VRTFDGHFAAHLGTTLVHVGPGGVVLALMLLQFSRRIRNRYRRFHRWSGRVVVVGGLASGFAGLYFGVVKPFGGNPERVAALVFGGIFIVSIVRGVLLARRGDFDGHREWMIRAAAVAFGIATIRVFATIIDPLLAPFGWRMASVRVAFAERRPQARVDVRNADPPAGAGQHHRDALGLDSGAVVGDQQ